MCIGVETHDLAPPRHDRGWVAGGFGHNRLKYDDAKVRELRVVQVGWAIGDVSSYAPPVTKSRIVKPNDFFITSAATKIHGIKHTDAVEKGDDLEDVLAEAFFNASSTSLSEGTLNDTPRSCEWCAPN